MHLNENLKNYYKEVLAENWAKLAFGQLFGRGKKIAKAAKPYVKKGAKIAGFGAGIGAVGMGANWLLSTPHQSFDVSGSNNDVPFASRSSQRSPALRSMRGGLDPNRALELFNASGVGETERKFAQIGTTGRERALARNLARARRRDMEYAASQGEDVSQQEYDMLGRNLKNMSVETGGNWGRVRERPSSTERARQNAEFVANYQDSERLNRLRSIEKHSPGLASSGAFEPLRQVERREAEAKGREDQQRNIRQARADEILTAAYAKQGRKPPEWYQDKQRAEAQSAFSSPGKYAPTPGDVNGGSLSMGRLSDSERNTPSRPISPQEQAARDAFKATATSFRKDLQKSIDTAQERIDDYRERIPNYRHYRA